jgi:hypothetical protein
MYRLTALVLVATLAMPAGVFAQASSAVQQAPAVDATKLGVDLSRIRRELSEAEAPAPSTEQSPIRLSFTVEVVGSAPKINLLEGFSLTGPLSYGSPTHQEVLSVLTPQAYRSPVVPVSSLAIAAGALLWKYGRKKQCEAEIENYRQLVMQGVDVAAPRCSK